MKLIVNNFESTYFRTGQFALSAHTQFFQRFYGAKLAVADDSSLSFHQAYFYRCYAVTSGLFRRFFEKFLCLDKLPLFKGMTDPFRFYRHSRNEVIHSDVHVVGRFESLD